MTTCQQEPFVGVTAQRVNDRTVVTFPDGRVVDATCSPWGEDDDGLQFVPLDGALWLWGAAMITPTQWGIVGRPVGDPACIRFCTTPQPDWRVWLGMHAQFGRVWYVEVGGITDQEPIDQLRTVFPIPPAASFILDVTSGTVPFTVIARLSFRGLTTWRWLLDDAIHQPITGDTHVFAITEPGTHAIGLRTSPAVDVAPQPVTALPAPVVVTPPVTLPTPHPAFRIGCQTGFGYPVGTDVLSVMKAKGWAVQRIGIDHKNPKKEWLLACVAEVQDAGLTPLVLIPTTLAEWVPEGVEVEFYSNDLDPTIMGAEADLRQLDPVAIAASVDAVMPMCREKGQAVYAGCVSNFSLPALDWLKRFSNALKAQDVVLTVHRYPDYGTRTSADPRKGFKTREDEYRALEAAVGDRPWAVTESGWHVGKYMKWQGDLYKVLERIWPGSCSFTLNRQQCADNCLGDARWVRDHGGLMYIWFQAWEGKEPDSGLRDIHDVWQPASDVPTHL